MTPTPTPTHVPLTSRKVTILFPVDYAGQSCPSCRARVQQSYICWGLPCEHCKVPLKAATTMEYNIRHVHDVQGFLYRTELSVKEDLMTLDSLDSDNLTEQQLASVCCIIRRSEKLPMDYETDKPLVQVDKELLEHCKTLMRNSYRSSSYCQDPVSDDEVDDDCPIFPCGHLLDESSDSDRDVDISAYQTQLLKGSGFTGADFGSDADYSDSDKYFFTGFD
jgi:hypothetical protein